MNIFFCYGIRREIIIKRKNVSRENLENFSSKIFLKVKKAGMRRYYHNLLNMVGDMVFKTM